MTQGNERRKKILALLEDASEPINATKIGEMLSVTRQIIVADIALLRASGTKIRALHRGYVLDKSGEGVKRVVMCKHDFDGEGMLRRHREGYVRLRACADGRMHLMAEAADSMDAAFLMEKVKKEICKTDV